MTSKLRELPIKNAWTLLVTAALSTLLLAGCTGRALPQLPPSSNSVAVADRLTGPDGDKFLGDVVSASWSDGGREAAQVFAWIPQDALSTDEAAAVRAGSSAHAVASYIADNRQSVAGLPANPALWQSLSRVLIPYLGAMIGDATEVAGFEPLDGPRSQMRRTSALFAAMDKDPDAIRALTDAASQRAKNYGASFAASAVADPATADRGDAQRQLNLAARLRSLVDTGAHLADPEREAPAPAHAQTEIGYQVVSLTAKPGDPHIDARFFRAGRLLSPSEIPESEWSLYDSQMTVYLAPWPRILDAIRQFGDTYNLIASGQQ